MSGHNAQAHAEGSTKLYLAVWIILLLLSGVEVYLGYIHLNLHLMLSLLMGLSLLALVPALLGPERSDSRRAGLLGLLILALVQLFLGLSGGYYGTFSGGAALVAWLLLVLPRR